MLPARYAFAVLIFWVIFQSNPHQGQVAATAKTSHEPKRTQPCPVPGIQEVVDASDSLQPPLAADAAIRIASKISKPCPVLARGLLQHAFDLAGSVTSEMAYTIGSGLGVSTDSRLFQTYQGYLLQEDQLSLRSRTVLAATPFDSKLAVDLFERTAPPRPAASGCGNPLVPEVALYYQAAEKVFLLLKARKPRHDGTDQAPFSELQETVSATTSSSQLLPLVNLLANTSANLSQSELTSLLNALAGAIDNLPLDDNAFYWREQYPAVKMYQQLAPLARAKQIPPQVLARAVHNYIERSLNGPHCEGNVPNDLKELVVLYKSLDRSTTTSDPAETLSVPATAPPIEPAPDPGEYWLGPKTKQLQLDAKHFNFDDNWNRYTEADRNTPEWRDRVQRLLNDIEGWHQNDEADPADYLHERCILLHSAIAYLPAGSLYNRMASMCLDTLAESTVQWDNPQEWDLEVHHFLEFSREDSLDFGRTDDKHATKEEERPIPAAAIVALKNSSNAYLHARGVIVEFLEQKEFTPTKQGGHVAAH